jgi:hypothetical protein
VIRRAAVVALLVYLAISLAPAAAAQETVVGSEHTSDVDFGNADALSNVNVQGEGDDAFVEFSNVKETVTWETSTDWSNPVSSKDVETDSSVQLKTTTTVTDQGYTDIVSRWKFDESSGVTANDDVSGYDGTINADTTYDFLGAASIHGEGGASYDFSSGDTVDVSHSYSQNSYTVSGWFVADSMSTGDVVIDGPGWNLEASTTTNVKLVAGGSDSSGSIDISSGRFIAILVDGNGVETLSGKTIEPSVSAPIEPTGTISFGGGYTGRMQDVRFWSKQISGDRYNLLKDNPTMKYPAESTSTESDGYLTTDSKFLQTASAVDLTGLDYSLNGGSITVEIVGSPGGSSEEVETVSLDGSTSYDLSWQNNHSEYRANVSMTLGSSSPTLNSLSLETASAGQSGLYVSDTHSIDSSATSGVVEFGKMSNAEANVEIQGYDGADWVTVDSSTVTSAGEETYDISGTVYDQWRVRTEFTGLSSTYNSTLTRDAIRVEFQDSPPEVVDGTATPTTSSVPNVTLSVDVDDPDFGTGPGDSVQANFYHRSTNDSSFSFVGGDSTNSAGTVSYDLGTQTGGTYEWYVELVDGYGNEVQSSTYTYSISAQLGIYNESAPSQLVDGENVSLEIRYFASDTVIEREAEGGKVDMSGLPLDQEFVVEADPSQDYHSRTIIFRSASEQQRLYLYPKDEENFSSTRVAFGLDDLTGNFPPESSRLVVERAITLNNETDWHIISGDYFGATATYTETLESDTRYRLSVVSENGQRKRSLGSYRTPEAATSAENVPVGQIDWSVSPTSKGYLWQTSVENTSSGPRIRFDFGDSEGTTRDLTVDIFEQGNESNLIYEDSEGGPIRTYSTSVSLTENQSEKTWVVEWNATRGNESIDGRRVEGSILDGVETPIDTDNPWWTFGMSALLVFIAGMFGGRNASVGAVIVAATAGVLAWMGWFLVPMSLVALAFFVALAYAAGRGP